MPGARYGHVTVEIFARVMAGGLLKAALCSTDKDHLDSVERCKAAKDEVSQFLKSVMEKDSSMDVFDTFSSNLSFLLV